MDPRKATVAILYNGVKAEVQLAPYLSSFKYTDVASGSSDSISISINDRDRKWINGWFPQKGDRLQPTIETCNWERDGQKKKFPCGKFLVDDFSFKGGPIRLDLEGLALPAASGFKATERTETYESTTLKEIGQIVAARAKVALHYEAGAVAVEKVEQNNQTDCAFFGSLVEKYGLALKIYNDKLVVFDEGKYEAKAPKFTLTEKEFEPGWSWNTKLDKTYTGVKYQYTNHERYTVPKGWAKSLRGLFHRSVLSVYLERGGRANFQCHLRAGMPELLAHPPRQVRRRADTALYPRPGLVSGVGPGAQGASPRGRSEHSIRGQALARRGK